MPVNTISQSLAPHVTTVSADDRAAVAWLTDGVQEATAEIVDLASLDQGYRRKRPAKAAGTHGIALNVLRLPEATLGFVLRRR